MADDSAARALHIADRMPLVHYPANARANEWSRWDGLASHAQRGRSPEPGPFGRLRNDHVFVYGGPCCYYHDNCIGDGVIYFAAGCEEGRRGSATPFDSGSLEDMPARLQPFRRDVAAEDARWDFYEEHCVELSEWRRCFAEWLAHCYDDPDRYLDSSSDRYAAGEPDRLRPPALLEHNGTRGRETYGEGECGDRRAWTWEIRIESLLPFDHVALLHIPYDSIEHVAAIGGIIRPLARDLIPTAHVLYEASGPILQELIGP